MSRRVDTTGSASTGRGSATHSPLAEAPVGWESPRDRVGFARAAAPGVGQVARSERSGECLN